MQRWHGLLQTILQILRDPALNGLGSIGTWISIPLAIFLARRPQTRQPQATRPRHNLKKIPLASPFFTKFSHSLSTGLLFKKKSQSLYITAYNTLNIAQLGPLETLR